MGKALYRKYRSRSLDEIVGQSHITTMLKRALDRGTIAHAYLLTGPRGVGKTSIARILAHEINHVPYSDSTTQLDIIEIDAASNNSVEDIRTLREKVMIAPVHADKKIYIIDEVHMLSKSAFNALLKTLEEPPEHVVFILATTDADKLPATILSRVQRFNFRLISEHDLAAHLRTIADAEKIAIDDDALKLIARQGKGSFRDSISLLDQLQNISDGNVTVSSIEAALGLATSEVVAQLLDAYRQQDLPTIVSLLNDIEARGTPAIVATEQIIAAVRTSIVSQPNLLPLLDQLLDVQRSAWPQVKLLTALAQPIAQSEKSTVSVPKKTTPKTTKASPQAVTPPKEMTTQKETPAPTKKPEPTTKTEHVKKTAAPTPKMVAKAPLKEFPWKEFLASLSTPAPGAHALLLKCAYEFDGDTLTIYAGKKFIKSQIEKALPKLSAALEPLNITAEISIVAVARPPKDDQTADVLALMGGGEEVSL